MRETCFLRFLNLLSALMVLDKMSRMGDSMKGMLFVVVVFSVVDLIDDLMAWSTAKRAWDRLDLISRDINRSD